MVYRERERGDCASLCDDDDDDDSVCMCWFGIWKVSWPFFRFVL